MVTQDIRYIGVNDKDLDLFEGQYIIPNGISYNSYVILDEKVAVMDTVDHRKAEEFLVNLEAVSYTHLDVYKRQGYRCPASAGGWGAPSWPWRPSPWDHRESRKY